MTASVVALITILCMCCGVNAIAPETRNIVDTASGLIDHAGIIVYDDELPTDEVSLDSNPKAKSRASQATGTDGRGQDLAEEFYFYRETLSASQKVAYDELTAALYDHKDSIPMTSSLQASDAGLIFESVMYDHPDIFWLSPGYSVRAKRDGTVTSYEVDFNATASNMREAETVMTQSVQALLDFANTLPSDADRVKAVHDYIAFITEYVDGCQFNQSAYASLATGKGVCTSYAKAFQYCMQKLRIPTGMVVGWVFDSNGEPETHAWNLVKLGGEYYAVDVTMDDIPGETSNDFRYDYFMFNEQNSGLQHTRLEISERLPASNGTTYNFSNYYRSNQQPTDFTGYRTEAEISLSASSPLEIVNEDGNSYLTGYEASPSTNTVVSFVFDEFDVAPGTHVMKRVLAADGYAKEPEDSIGTGDIVAFDSVSDPVLRTTVVMRGDVLGSGKLSITQLVEISRALKTDGSLEGPYLMAADLNGNGRVDLTDVTRAASLIMGKGQQTTPESAIKTGLYAEITHDPTSGAEIANAMYVTQTDLQKKYNRLQFSIDWGEGGLHQQANATVEGHKANYVWAQDSGTQGSGYVEFDDDSATVHFTDGEERIFQWIRDERWELTPAQLREVASELGVPSSLDVTYMQGTARGVWPGYWVDGERYYIHLRIIANDQVVAYACVDPITLEFMRSVYEYQA